MYSMWLMWFSHRRCKSQVFCKLKILVHSNEIRHFICEDYNISTKMICLDHESGDF